MEYTNESLENIKKELDNYCNKNLKPSCNGYWLNKDEALKAFDNTSLEDRGEINKLIDSYKYKEGMHLLWLKDALYYFLNVPNDDLLIPNDIKHHFSNQTHFDSRMQKMIWGEDD